MRKHTDFTNSLEDERLRNGYSFKRIATLLELPTPQLIAKWENGETAPSLEYLLKLMSLYHMNPTTMYPKLYKQVDDRVSELKEKFGVPLFPKPLITKSNYAHYLNVEDSETVDKEF